MKSWREIRIEQAIKSHDPELFLNKNYRGELQVMRKGKTLQSQSADGIEILVVTPTPHYIMSLTDTWTSKGVPVDWGLEPIVNRLREIDDWGGESAFDRMLKANERREELKKNAFKGLTEDIAREWRHDLKKHTDDVLTHSMDRKKDPRYKGDRKYGNY